MIFLLQLESGIVTVTVKSVALRQNTHKQTNKPTKTGAVISHRFLGFCWQQLLPTLPRETGCYYLGKDKDSYARLLLPNDRTSFLKGRKRELQVEMFKILFAIVCGVKESNIFFNFGGEGLTVL